MLRPAIRVMNAAPRRLAQRYGYFQRPHCQVPFHTVYVVEKARGSSPDHRVQIRQAKAKLAFDDLEIWLHVQLPGISGKSPLAGAIRYALTQSRCRFV